MTARVLDGQALSATMREEIKPEVQAFVKAHGRPPGLGIVLVGEDPASHVYVRNKLKAAEDVGFYADCDAHVRRDPRSTTCWPWWSA